MSVSQADVNRIAPELSVIAPADFAVFLSDALLQVDPATWGPLLDVGTKNLVAHMMALSRPDLTSPYPVSEEQVGPVRRKFGVTGPKDPDAYDTTKYGREFKRLRRMLGQGIGIT